MKPISFRGTGLRFFCLSLICILLTGCPAGESKLKLSAGNKQFPLRGLTSEARRGELKGASSSAWFAFTTVLSEMRNPLNAAKNPVALEIRIEYTRVENGTSSPVQISLGFLTDADFTSPEHTRLVSDPAPRNLAIAEEVRGNLLLRMQLPKTEQDPVCGFAVSCKGNKASAIKITEATLVPAETGWQKLADCFWTGFTDMGGTTIWLQPDNTETSDSESTKKLRLPSVELDPDSLLTIYTAPVKASEAEAVFTGADISNTAPDILQKQGRIRFSAGRHSFGILNSSTPGMTVIPAFFITSVPVSVLPTAGADALTGMRVRIDTRIPAERPNDPLSPVTADPYMIIEWPQSAWRRADREVFSWDRFPSILIFDTADYAVQDRLFKRLAFFVEKEGYRGKLWKDSETAGLHGYNAHDYRAESLAAFFDQAEKEQFPLNRDERELRDILVAEGIIIPTKTGYTAGTGAVLSISRQSASYLRYLFMAHEGYHGIYFTDADYREKVSSVYHSMDTQAIAFLESYFTVVDSLGYDTADAYLMENEFMAYLMQQPLNRVSAYFTGTTRERFLRYGGDSALADYITKTNASEFVQAAAELNVYVNSRWGIRGGRVGLFFSGD